MNNPYDDTRQGQEARKRDATDLLMSPAFKRLVEGVAYNCFDEFCATLPDDTAKREQLYYTMLGANTIVAHVNAWADSSEE